LRVLIGKIEILGAHGIERELKIPELAVWDE
jgi:hypothetical protein